MGQDSEKPSEQVSIFNKFDDPFKFWKYQLSFPENQIKDLEKSPYAEDDASQIMKGLLIGLNNIHEMNYIHRDIKPENILVKKATAENGDPRASFELQCISVIVSVVGPAKT